MKFRSQVNGWRKVRKTKAPKPVIVKKTNRQQTT